MSKRSLPEGSSRPTSPKQVRFHPENVPEGADSDSVVTGSESETCASASESETFMSETEPSSDEDEGSVNLAHLSENDDDIPLVTFSAHEPMPKYVPYQDSESGDEEPYFFPEPRNALGPIDMSKDPGEQIRKQILHVKNSTHCSDSACDGFIKIINNITEHTNLKGCLSKCYKSVRNTSLGNLPTVSMRYMVLDKERQAIKEERNKSSFPYSVYGNKKKFKVLAKFYEIPLKDIWKFHTDICEDHDEGYLLCSEIAIVLSSYFSTQILRFPTRTFLRKFYAFLLVLFYTIFALYCTLTDYSCLKSTFIVRGSAFLYTFQ